jgi:hypothetical protein
MTTLTHSWTSPRLPGLALLILLGAPACHLDSGLMGAITGSDHNVPPDVPETTLSGRFTVEEPFGVPSAAVTFYQPNGSRIEGLSTVASSDGTFSVNFEGTRAFTNMLIYGTAGSLAHLGLVPNVPTVSSVYEPGPILQIGAGNPLMDPIDDVSTTILLLLEGNQRQRGGSLSDLDEFAMRTAINDLAGLLDDEPYLTFRQMVTRLFTAASESEAGVPVFVAPDQTRTAGSSLSPAFLASVSVDYTGDGTPDDDVAAYEDALRDAMENFGFDICYHPDLIRVVFMVDFRDGGVDAGNCAPINRTKWLDGLDPGDVMHIVGGVHESQVRCENDPNYEFCATAADVALTNEALGFAPAGGWNPNRIRIFDDGTNGDAVAGDGIYSRAFDLPRGIRIGYKYTYGPPAAGWTGTEEWPGNQRLLELIDVNGDHMIVRYDIWGDETTNKDRQNLRSPGNGGRGAIVWECNDPEAFCCAAADNPEGVGGCVDADRNGIPDYHESPVDLDGDCVVDGWPDPGPNTPITVPCDEG